MKLESVTKLDKGNKATLKNFGNDVMPANCDVIACSIYGQFEAIRKLASGCMVCKTYPFINSSLVSHKN